MSINLADQVKVLDAKGLGVKEARWVTAFTLPTTGEIWYRAFHYKTDAEQLRTEVVTQFSTLAQVLGHYGSKYWTRLEETPE